MGMHGKEKRSTGEEIFTPVSVESVISHGACSIARNTFNVALPRFARF